MKNVRTFDELFAFYNDYVRILYGRIQAQNALPQETLYEINAAFDHISRCWTRKHPEADEVKKACSHLKRSCLDIFKLTLKDTVDHYHEIYRHDTSIIDNGAFDLRMHKMIEDIKALSVQARQSDSENNDHEDINGVFKLLGQVYDMCQQFDQDFFLSPHIQWARKKNRIYSINTFVLSVAASFVAGLLLCPPFLGVLFKIKTFLNF